MIAGSTFLRFGLLTLLLCVALCAPTHAAPVQTPGYITMSDGVKLRYTVVLPAATGRFPVALKYDGYCEGTDPMTCNGTADSAALLAAGFAVLGVSARGTGCSEGQFDFRSPGESADGAAVVEWAARQAWSTGHVGMFGDSFPGLLQPGVAALRPAGLDAIAPFQIVDDLYRDVAYHGGIAEGEFGVYWGLGDQPVAAYSSVANGTEAGDPQCGQSAAGQVPVNPPHNIFVTGFQHPYIDSFWASKVVGAAAGNIAVPAFGCQSWQDDEVGSRSAWTLWPRLDPARTWVVATNGYHSMCVVSTPIINQLVRFFDRFVKGDQNGFETTPHMQIWHDTTGVTDAKPTWVTSSSNWPPTTDTNKLYLASGAALTAAPPSGAEPADSYASPTVSAGTENGIIAGQSNWLWKQPGTAGGALAYTTPKLAHAVEMLGPASVDLWLDSTATDTNLQATITEVRPDGQEVYVARGWLRASQRKLDQQASTPTMPVQTDLQSDVQSLVPAEPTFIRFEVFPFDYVFRGGSRIRLVIDTPSQTGGWNFEPVANAGVNSILHDSEHPSKITVGTIPRATAGAGYPTCDTLLNQPCRPDAFTASDPPGQLDWPKPVVVAGGTGAGGDLASAVPGAANVTACVPAKGLTFRINPVPYGRVLSARVSVNGRHVLTKMGHNVTRVSFKRPRGARLVVRITTTSNRGVRVLTRLTFSGCTRTNVRVRKLTIGWYGRQHAHHGILLKFFTNGYTLSDATVELSRGKHLLGRRRHLTIDGYRRPVVFHHRHGKHFRDGRYTIVVRYHGKVLVRRTVTAP